MGDALRRESEADIGAWLAGLGWTSGRTHEVEALGFLASMGGRVLTSSAHMAEVLTPSGVRSIRGLGLEAGDWVVLEEDRLLARLERTTTLRRQSVSRDSRNQVLAVNVDYVLIAEPLDGPPNLRRIERMLAIAWESGATPLVVLTRSDLGDTTRVHDVQNVAIGVDVVTSSSVELGGTRDLIELIQGRSATLVLIGPSGVGKSTLVNALAGKDVRTTGAIKADGKGRHTTTDRHLVPIPGVGILLDTPGIRSVGVVDGGIDQVFGDIIQLAKDCRFRDCHHGTEPGCAVRDAVHGGRLASARLENYLRLEREADWHAARGTAMERATERKNQSSRKKGMRVAMRAKGK